MLSAYVKSQYKNVAASDKVASLNLVDVNGSNFRLLGVQFIPSVNRQNGAVTQSGIELSNGDGGSVFFKDSICPSSYKQTPYSYFESISMMDILPHGILVNNSSDVYVKGTGIGISFVFVTYQVG
tara:strand:+ start:487 stop:861 length:375 start_codon:yes stop_codon:yes gene_type:complete